MSNPKPSTTPVASTSTPLDRSRWRGGRTPLDPAAPDLGLAAAGGGERRNDHDEDVSRTHGPVFVNGFPRKANPAPGHVPGGD